MLLLGLFAGLGVALAPIGTPAAVALTRVIASRLSGVTPTDPATFAAAAVLFVSIALLESQRGRQLAAVRARAPGHLGIAT